MYELERSAKEYRVATKIAGRFFFTDQVFVR